MMHGKVFVKKAELPQLQGRTLMANIMGSHGIRNNEPAPPETTAQVRAAIKELFPRIPEPDLENIVAHAWKEGSRRIGTSIALDLPRRVQLAVTAHVRHVHTDYDRLLRAFDWNHARMEVEQDCVKKLVEWRGEHDGDDNDDELEEIVREIIVIEDDERGITKNDGEADDEQSVIDVDDSSDASVEVIEHLPADGELTAESAAESSRAYSDRLRATQQRAVQHSRIARQKIDVARQQIRRGLAESLPTAASQSHHRTRAGTAYTAGSPLTSFMADARPLGLGEIEFNGQVYRRVSQSNLHPTFALLWGLIPMLSRRRQCLINCSQCPR